VCILDFGGGMIMPIAPIKEYNSKAKKEAKLEES
jgi:hypothetical protein